MARQSLFRTSIWLFLADLQIILASQSMPFLTLDNQVTFASITNSTEKQVELREVYNLAENLPHIIKTFGTWEEGQPVQIPIPSWIQRRSNLTGLHLRCTTLEQPPFTYLSNPDSQLNVAITGGYAGDVWRTLQEQLGFTYSCRQPADGEWGTQSATGVWSGLVKDLLDKNADVVVTSLDRNPLRSTAIDFLSGLREVGYQLIARRVGLMDATWTSFTNELVPASWMATIAFAVFVPPCLALCTYFSPLETEKINFKDAYIITIGAFTAQGSELDVKSLSTRIVFITIFLTTLLVSAHYTSALVSLFTVASTSSDFTTLQDLVNDGSFKFGFLRGISIQQEFEKAKSGQYHDVWKKLVNSNPRNLPETNAEGIQRVINEKYIHMMEENLYRTSYGSTCDTMMIDGKYFKQQTGFAVAKGSPLQAVFNAKIMRMRDGGILSRLWDRWQPPPALCTIDSVYALDIQQLFTAFLLLLFGLVVAIIFLPCERIHWNAIGKEKAFQKLFETRNGRSGGPQLVTPAPVGFISQGHS